MSQTLSCPTAAPSVEILRTGTTPLREQNIFTDSDAQRACELRAQAEKTLTNGTMVSCLPLYAASRGSLGVLPPNRGPDPPFLIAIRLARDASWVLRLVSVTNATAVLLADPVNGSSGVYVNSTKNISMSTSTLFLLVQQTPEWMSSIVVHGDAACGYQHAAPEFVVTWPQKDLSTAVQVIVGLVSGGSTVSGNPTAASALAMVGLLSCSGSTPALQSAGYFVSLFFNLGPAAVGGGNLGLIVAMLGLHYAVARVWMLGLGANTVPSMDVAMADVRFPAVTIFGAMYLLPGAVYGGVVSITSGEDIAVGVIVLIAVGVLVVGSQVLLAKFVLPLTFFEPYPCPHPTAFVFERVAMLPASRWVPESMERRFMPLLGTRSRAWSLLSVADLLLALCLSAATGVGVGTKGAACSVMPVLVGVIYYSCALLHIVLRPYRRPIDTFVFPAVWILFGTLCILKYTNTSGHEDLIDKMQLALSTLQLFQTACAVVVFVRERQWRVFIQRGIDEGRDEWKPQVHGDDSVGLATLMMMEYTTDNEDEEMMIDVLSDNDNDLTSSFQRRGRRDRSNSMSAAQQAVVEDFWRTNWQTPAAASDSLRADRRSASNRKEVSDVVRALRLATQAERNVGGDYPDQRQHEEDDDDDVDVDNMLLSWQLPSSSPEEGVFVNQLGDGLELSDDDFIETVGPRRVVQPLTLLSPPSTDVPATISLQRSTVLSKGRSAGRKKAARRSAQAAPYDDI